MKLKPLNEVYWRASLVPAAAVIPAPEVYANVAAVKTLIVDTKDGESHLTLWGFITSIGKVVVQGPCVLVHQLWVEYLLSV